MQSVTPTTAGPYRRTDLFWLAGTAAGYALLAKIVLTFFSTNGLVTVFWPASGISLAALLLGGRKFWPGVYLGAVAGQLWMGQSPGNAALIALGSTAEPLLGVWLLLRKGDFDASLRSNGDFFRLVYLAGALSPAVCALIGVGTLAYSGRIPANDLWQHFVHWWMGDTLGIVIVAPLVMVWRRPPPRQHWHFEEAAVFFGLSFLVGQIVFLDWFSDEFGLVNRGYWMYLVVCWGAMRLGLHGVLLMLLLTTLQALVGAAHGVGYFGNDLATTQLTNFWAYTMILAPVGMSLAIICSQRERIMAELRLNEERLRLASAAADQGIYDRDIPSRMLAGDERARKIWGIGPNEPISYATFIAGVHPEDRAATEAAIDRALNPYGTGEYYAEHRVISRSDGSVRHVAAHGRVLFEAGQAVRLIGTVRDVSAQKRLEQEVQERRVEMEQLVNQQIAAQTAAAIAHELNQPLVSVSAYSEAALRMLLGGTKSPEKLAHALEGAVEQAQRAGRTLHQLLDFLHKGETTLEPVDLNGVVRDAITLSTESGCGGYRAIVELEPDMQPVLANRLQLKKVLVNLLRNGVEAMRSAEVPAGAMMIKVRALAGSNMAQVTVQDAGPGLDAKIAARIFEPFITTKPEGIGLGLAISRALIESHGGQLWVEPEAGPGATFHFTLPFAS